MWKDLIDNIHTYTSNPLVLLAIFVITSFVMIWRLQVMEHKGFEGTVLGTLIMPYCSGFANLIFAYVMSRSASNGGLVIENCIVNNTTNLTLILGFSVIFGAGASITTQKGATKNKSKNHAESHRINRLNLLFTLIALFLFTGTLWALAKDQILDFYDGLVLVALFVFWQVLHVFEILKDNIRKNKAFQWSIIFDLLLIAASAYCIYYSVDHLVEWISTSDYQYINISQLGWLSGVLMVLPNAFIALYYSRIGRQDIVLSSQIGDGHICIPMCIGLFSLFNTIQVPGFFQTGMYIILGAGVVHFLSIVIFGRIPKFIGLVLVSAYVFFFYKGIIQ
jgi:cation:H+ antiporter